MLLVVESLGEILTILSVVVGSESLWLLHSDGGVEVVLSWSQSLGEVFTAEVWLALSEVVSPLSVLGGLFHLALELGSLGVGLVVHLEESVVFRLLVVSESLISNHDMLVVLHLGWSLDLDLLTVPLVLTHSSGELEVDGAESVDQSHNSQSLVHFNY